MFLSPLYTIERRRTIRKFLFYTFHSFHVNHNLIDANEAK